MCCSDFSVFVHSKGFWRWAQWKGFDVLNVVRKFSEVRCIVKSTFTKFIVGLEHIWRNILLKNGLDQSHVLVISHSSSIIYFCTQVIEHFVWNDRIFIQQHCQLFFAYIKVLVGEFVGNVPSNRAKFSTVLYDCMEKTKSKQKFFVLDRLGTFVKLFFRNGSVRS